MNRGLPISVGRTGGETRHFTCHILTVKGRPSPTGHPGVLYLTARQILRNRKSRHNRIMFSFGVSETKDVTRFG